MASVTLSIQNMSCASCVGRVEAALTSVPGVSGASVNLANDTAHVRYNSEETDSSEIAKTVTNTGYPTQIATTDHAIDHSLRKMAEANYWARQTLIAACLAAPVVTLEMGGHMIPAFHYFIGSTLGHDNSAWIQFALTTLILAGPGRIFFARGVPALLRRAPDMNSLVFLGTGAAYLYSLVVLFAPELLPDGVRRIYFEPAAVIVALILLGRFLETRAKGRTGAAIQSLLQLQPKTAQVRRNGKLMSVDIDDLLVGDHILVQPGARIPVDGEVLSGESRVNEAMLSGEPVPTRKTVGALVMGGTVNGSGPLDIRATHVGANTTLSQIIRMVEDAQGAKLPIQAYVDRITLWFVPAVLGLAVLTVLMWLAFGPNPALSSALVAGVSVLIIACPCAMGLATPTSIMVGTGRAAEMGVLFRKGDALQTLANARTIAFDKTGTLTEGRPELTALVLTASVQRHEVLRLAAAIELRSEHPIAHAILRAAADLEVPIATDAQTVTGQGISGKVDGRYISIGNAKFAAAQGVNLDAQTAEITKLAALGNTVLFMAIDGLLTAVIAVSDPIKASTADTIAKLDALGFETVVITGDAKATANVIAKQLNIKHVIADVLPDGKRDAVLGLEGTTVFVGDGINDAPALATADVGIAIGTGTDVAINSADVVLMSGDLQGVLSAIKISRATMRNIRQNLFWAFAYNTALIPIAAGILYPAFGLLLSPVLAAGAMALSSVFVLTNALRLRWVSPA
ncbi:heavy metal translocating P-type ATPase [Thalassobium sp. R2A62]|uniref:heavy metal translocating P-type ATPase n=1 Tax=Thalassobium sp. R2A62 TaxID=633131 RepID=UPI0001B1CBBD|nr:heavy metal translocating P-type ATPase [Thalassobium sp. R2A62]EET46427.1 copper-translocating P-type ATPase [Thalassobium sp. R2A62]